MSSFSVDKAAANPRTRENNFDILRVYAAMMVIYGHGFNMIGGVGPGLFGVPFARVGLDVFFAISGYLVTGSWEATPKLVPFFTKRWLRIFPALIVVVVGTAFVIGPIMSTMPTREYLRSPQTWWYLTNIMLLMQQNLPQVFAGLHENGATNGSLWSLFPELLCYLTVPLFALLPWRPRIWTLALFGLSCGILGLWLFYGQRPRVVSWYHADWKYIFVEVPFFMFGALFRLLERRVPNLYRADFAVIGFALNQSVASWYGWWDLPIEWITISYTVVTVGRMALPVLSKVGKIGDISYGLYLYAFPIQQIILVVDPKNRFPILTCMLATIPVAFLSWHLVEKPAMRLLPRRMSASPVSAFTPPSKTGESSGRQAA